METPVAAIASAESAEEVLELAASEGRVVRKTLVKMLADAEAAATAAGLRYVHAHEPGYHRVRRGKGFAVVDAHGRFVKNAKVLARIAALVIPPAWTDVWVCKTQDGHLQAVGRDVRGRKQYRYHPKWRAIRDAAKYTHLRDFCRALPKLRARVEQDLACRCLCKEKVVAAVVALIERAQIRVGNDEYTKSNGSYGATTLRCRHVRVRGQDVRLCYRGKSGKPREVKVRDGRLAKVIEQCMALPGSRLFRYRDARKRRMVTVTSSDVNAYVQLHTGGAFTAKDFRTWAATIAAAIRLAHQDVATSERLRKRRAAEVVRRVAEQLGNTASVCRKSYIHPLLLGRYVQGQLDSQLARLRALEPPLDKAMDVSLLVGVENEVFAMLAA